MLRYNLSKAFSRVAYAPFKNQQEHRKCSRDYYRDKILKDTGKILAHFHYSMDIEKKETGEAEITLKRAIYPDYELKLKCSTEWSDLLLASGRAAAIKLETGDTERVFYYGDSNNPDNYGQFVGRLDYQWDIEKIALGLQDIYYHYLPGGTRRVVMPDDRRDFQDNNP